MEGAVLGPVVNVDAIPCNSLCYDIIHYREWNAGKKNALGYPK